MLEKYETVSINDLFLDIDQKDSLKQIFYQQTLIQSPANVIFSYGRLRKQHHVYVDNDDYDTCLQLAYEVHTS